MAFSSKSSADEMHKLSNKWTIYAHLPHDTDWSLNSYKTIFSTDTMEEFITLTESLPDKLISNCMLFIMKDNIKPIWEDSHNKNGGCFSYKISNKTVSSMWRKFSYKLVGNTLLRDCSKKYKNNINGITISPKKNFCIIKIWFSDCSNQDPETIDYFKGVDSYGCLFKKHFNR
jgi:translation initiation factor 4E